MTAKAKAICLGVIGASAGIVYFVHASQADDRVRLREGVLLDIERQERKAQNKRELLEQLALQRRLEAMEAQAAAPISPDAPQARQPVL